MVRVFLLAAALVVSASAEPVLAQSSGPRAVVAAIDRATQECRASGGRFVASPEFNVRLPLNQDEAPDHVLNYGEAECEGAGATYSGAARSGMRDDGCGRDGCRVEVFLSGPSGHQRVFSEPVWAVETVRELQPARLRFSASSMPGCTASYAEGCHAEWGWDGGSFQLLRWIAKDDMAWAQADYDPAETSPVHPALSGEEEVRAFFTALFQPFVDERPGLSYEEIFTPAMLRRIDRASDPDVGLGCDPVIGGQDFMDVRYRVETVTVRGEEARAIVRVSSWTDSPLQPRAYLLRRTPAGWRIEDQNWSGVFQFTGEVSC
jgi:hypothetical protein